MNSIQNGYTISNHYAISKFPLPLPNSFSSWKTCVQQGWNLERFVTYLNLHKTINFLIDFRRDCNKFSGPFSTDSSLALKVDQNVYHLRFLWHGNILLNHTFPIYRACIHPPGRPGKNVHIWKRHHRSSVGHTQLAPATYSKNKSYPVWGYAE
jgi:hypothetical protein